jgi:hypothetical protein
MKGIVSIILTLALFTTTSNAQTAEFNHKTGKHLTQLSGRFGDMFANHFFVINGTQVKVKFQSPGRLRNDPGE